MGFGFAGPDRDQYLEQMKSLVQNYCVLDQHLQIRPNLIAGLGAEEAARLAQLENAENPTTLEETIPDYSAVWRD